MDTMIAIGVALLLAGVAVVGATVTGEQEKLCAALGGTYKPAPPPADVCANGNWLNLFKAAPQK